MVPIFYLHLHPKTAEKSFGQHWGGEIEKLCNWLPVQEQYSAEFEKAFESLMVHFMWIPPPFFQRLIHQKTGKKLCNLGIFSHKYWNKGIQ